MNIKDKKLFLNTIHCILVAVIIYACYAIIRYEDFIGVIILLMAIGFIFIESFLKIYKELAEVMECEKTLQYVNKHKSGTKAHLIAHSSEKIYNSLLKQGLIHELLNPEFIGEPMWQITVKGINEVQDAE